MAARIAGACRWRVPVRASADHPVGQRFGQLVVGGGRHAQRIAQGRRGDHRAVRRHDHRVHERLGRDRDSGGTCRHRSRAFWLRSTANQSTKAGSARCAGRAAWRARLRGSSRSGWRASGPRPRCARAGRSRACRPRLSSLARSAWRSRRTGSQHLLERLAQPVGRLDQAGVERAHVAFHGRSPGPRRPPARAPAGAPGPGIPRPGRAPCRRRAASASWARAGGGEVEQAAQRVLRLDVLAQQVADAALEPARAAAAASLGAQEPAPRSAASMPLKCAAKAPSAASNR